MISRANVVDWILYLETDLTAFIPKIFQDGDMVSVLVTQNVSKLYDENIKEFSNFCNNVIIHY